MNEDSSTRRRGVPVDHPRRLELHRTAARLFAELGFKGTSMSLIAKEMGVTKGSLYYWVTTKDELLESIIRGNLSTGLKTAEAIVAQELSARERLRQLVEINVLGWATGPYHYRALREAQWLSPESYAQYKRDNMTLEDLFAQVIYEGIAGGEFKIPHKHVPISVKLLFGLMGNFSTWYREDGWASPPMITALIFNQIVLGLSGGDPRDRAADVLNAAR